MLPKKPIRPKKPLIEKKEHKVEPGKDEDVVVKVGGFRVYFQNYYTIVSLTNDLLTGGLYLSGSLVQTFTNMERIGMYLYIFASFFLLMRPVLKILQYVYLYNKEEYEKQILGEAEENFKPGEELKGKNDEVKKQKSEEKPKVEADADNNQVSGSKEKTE
ncbi:YrhK-like protein [Alkalibacterium subtropicum]|uniref:YrhK-like protein n=1 Tax=Alkalibacterium subtropicum TaxID=753702 RepID=A0A1I1HRM3_9LACT|nr:YrhK family protein [Alkalibacterium subtropicum]SFC26747.1 YrhK-like protein [Alkalibacterium subtropicum]